MEVLEFMEDRRNQTVHDYIEMFLRRRWIVISSIIVSTGAAVYISLVLPAYYRSTTLILVEQQKIPEQYVTPADRTPIGQRLNTIKHQVTSRTNLERIIREFGLYGEDSIEMRGGVLSRLLRSAGLKKADRPTMEDMVERMRKDIEVKIIGADRRTGGDAFSISYTGRDPVLTMEVTNTLASMFIEKNLRIREQYAEGTSEFLASELEKAKEELERQEAALRRFKEEHMGALPEQLDANLRTLDRLQLELQSVNNSLKTTLDRKTFIEEQLGIVGRSGASPLHPLEVELQRLKGELASLRSLYKDSYPDVIMTRSRIRDIERRLEEERDGEGEKASGGSAPGVAVDPANMELYEELAATESQIETLRAREGKIKEQIRFYEKRVEDTPANEQRLAALERDYDISLDNYKTLLEKRLMARVAENLEKRQKGERFRVIDPANLPQRPFRPDRQGIVLMGLFFGLGLGAGLAFLLEFLNPAFRKPEDFQDVIPLPVISVIPELNKSRGKWHGRLRVLKGKRAQ